MAQVPTIPVQTGEYDPQDRKTFNLPYGTRVIIATGLPADITDYIIKPSSGSLRKKYTPEGQMAKHYEIRYRPDLADRWGRTKGLDPNAGQLIRMVSPEKLHGLPAHTSILFLVDEVWHRGTIQPYEDAYKARQEAEKAEKKAKLKHRKYLRQPTVWDRLLTDD